MKDYEIYLFDFDGTLVDSKDALAYVFKKSYQTMGITIDENEVLELMRIPLSEGYVNHGCPQEKWNDFVKTIRDILMEHESIIKTKEFIDVYPTLLKLKQQGKILGIVTSNDNPHVLEVLNFMGYDKNIFSVIVGSTETMKIKPDPEPINIALEELGLIASSKIVYVGDSVNDAQAAINAKIDYYLLDRFYEYHSSKYKIIHSLEELLL